MAVSSVALPLERRSSDATRPECDASFAPRSPVGKFSRRNLSGEGGERFFADQRPEFEHLPVAVGDEERALPAFDAEAAPFIHYVVADLHSDWPILVGVTQDRTERVDHLESFGDVPVESGIGR